MDPRLHRLFQNHCRWYSTLQAIDRPSDLIRLLTNPNIGLSRKAFGDYSLLTLAYTLKAMGQVDVCVPNLRGYEYIPIVVDKDGTLSSPLLEQIQGELVSECHHQSRFALLPLYIVWPDQGTGHANLMLIDYELQTIEHFEPNGSGELLRGVGGGQVSEWILETIVSHSFFQDYTYYPSLQYCPAVGPHSKAYAVGPGFCQSFTALYFHLRLLDPEESRAVIVQMIMDRRPHEITNLILRYNYLWEQLLPRALVPGSTKEEGELLNLYLNTITGVPYSELINTVECGELPSLADGWRPASSGEPLTGGWSDLFTRLDAPASTETVRDYQREPVREDHLLIQPRGAGE